MQGSSDRNIAVTLTNSGFLILEIRCFVVYVLEGKMFVASPH